MTRRLGFLATSRRAATAVGAALLLAGIVTSGPGCSATPKGEAFASPEAGGEAIAAALRANDEGRIRAILGPEADEVLTSGDEVADRNRKQAYLKEYDAKHGVVMESDGRATITVGQTDWPMPIPLVREDGSWRFDVARGKDEMLARRVGRNELSTIQVCRAVVDAQKEYYAGRVGGVGAYAAKFLSTPGEHDGLYWATKEGEPPSPLGALVAQAQEEGYRASADRSPAPYQGYYYRILSGQGPAAPGGARSYMENGRLTGGFGVVAYPATYGNSGVMTFVVNQNGIVYQRDAGSDTLKAGESMAAFDPDERWTIVP